MTIDRRLRSFLSIVSLHHVSRSPGWGASGTTVTLVRCLLAGVVCTGPGARVAGAQGGTDIWIVPLVTEGSSLRLGAPARNLTSRPGYDNQPFFGPDGTLYYTSIRDDAQADIYRITLPRGEVARVTSTPESEYSPRPTPDGTGITVVRVERDSTQRLWVFPVNGDPPRVLLPGLAPVGYYAWTTTGDLLAFVLGSPSTLQLAAPGSDSATTLALDVGRSLQRIPGTDRISVLIREPDTPGRIMAWEPGVARLEPLTLAVPGAQDFAWTPAGTLLMARGRALFGWTPGREEWETVGTLDAPGTGAATRLAVSPDGAWLAVVLAEGGA